MTLAGSDYHLLTALTKQSPGCQGRIPLPVLSAATGLSDRTVRRRLKVLRIHGLVNYQKIAGRHLEFEISHSAYVVLNNMGVLVDAVS